VDSSPLFIMDITDVFGLSGRGVVGHGLTEGRARAGMRVRVGPVETTIRGVEFCSKPA
jgi:translation elongation factor EF-Tu-like GTPase